MILDTLTKFNMRRKLWMTPGHPLCGLPEDIKVMYGAAVILQAQVDKENSPLNNFELERLLKAGLKLDSSNIAWAMRISRNSGEVAGYLPVHLATDREQALLIMDLINVSINNGEIKEESAKSAENFARLLSVPMERFNLLKRFICYAYEENIKECQRFASIIEERIPGIDITDLKYYIMQITETTGFTQEILDEKKHQKIIDRCNIYGDIVLNEGMSLVIDNAVVRVFGNIAIYGGTLVINNSKIVRKSDRHRACINLHTVNSSVKLTAVEADCRNYGMLIRAEEGIVNIENSNIYHTTRGAAVRFWGKELVVKDTGFYGCYSPEDGGAVMARGGSVNISGCRFYDCEAKRGGAVYGINGTVISGCSFTRCNVAEYGAAVYYSGNMEGSVSNIKYTDCHPTGAEVVQHISGYPLSIGGETRISISAIIDCPLIIEGSGSLFIENVNLYLNYPIRCSGRLYMKNSRIVSNHLEDGDMIYLDNARECKIHHCELDGMLKTGGLNLLGTRISITKSLFRNMSGGRAVYNAYQPEISDCIFNFCQKGAVYSQGGNIARCVFVNCRAKSGAGVQMYGRRGIVNNCIFRRCVSSLSGGAIDKAVGINVTKCVFEDCKPDNIS